MRSFTTEEDTMLEGLVAEHGPKWKIIASLLTAQGPNERTHAMVRNRFLRRQKGKVDAAEGKARNRCGQCGQLKKGHVCTKAGSLEVSGDLTAQMDAHRTARFFTQSANAENLPPVAPSKLALGSPMPLTFDANMTSHPPTSLTSHNEGMATLFAALPGLVTADATVASDPTAAPPIAAASVAPWSPATSPGDYVPSPDITAASLLAPTPEGMSYTFPYPSIAEGQSVPAN